MENTSCNNATLKEVSDFLEELRLKLKFQQVNWDQRSKNLNAYAMLREWGYSSLDLVEFIKCLTPSNYFQGPLPDNDNIPTKGPLWVFGMFIKPKNKKRKKEKLEFYIKIQIGWPNKEVICISFHPKEDIISYPLATSENEQ